MIIDIMTTAVATIRDIHTSKDIGNRKVNQEECKAFKIKYILASVFFNYHNLRLLDPDVKSL